MRIYLGGFLSLPRHIQDILSVDHCPELFCQEPQGSSLRDTALALVARWPDFPESMDVIGYSYGGRLALALALAAPNRVRRLVLVSAHVGLESESLRITRLARDELWARRFEGDPWEGLLSDWDAQSALGGRFELPRPEFAYNRARLASVLRFEGLGSQPPFGHRLGEIRSPVLLVSGASDVSYCDLYASVRTRFRNAKHVVIGGSGHRVPFDQPRNFEACVEDFLGAANWC